MFIMYLFFSPEILFSTYMLEDLRVWIQKDWVALYVAFKLDIWSYLMM